MRASMAVCIQACVNICACVICVRVRMCERTYIYVYYFKYLDRFSKNPQVLNFVKIGPVGAELFLADGRA